jgi:hypothetical protein
MEFSEYAKHRELRENSECVEQRKHMEHRTCAKHRKLVERSERVEHR